MTRRRWLLAACAVAAALVATALPASRLRYLALPLASDPSVPVAVTPRAIDEAPAAAVEAARVPGRVSAILPLGDALFVGTFDEGLYRCARACDAVGGLDGRERFVDALIAYQGRVVAATHRGAIVLARDGERIGVLAAQQAVSSLAVVDGELVLGTAHGLWRARGDAAVGERGPDGETLRVTALAAARGKLWIGTPDGVYALATPLGAHVAAWHPLVFGAPAASTNVVTALVAAGDGVLAGTDDGGTVLVDDRGVHAAPFADAAANDVNPGAVARAGTIALVGTEGAGLVALTGSHARRLAHGRISAVAADGATLFFGDEDGAVYAFAASKIFWMSAS